MTESTVHDDRREDRDGESSAERDAGRPPAPEELEAPPGPSGLPLLGSTLSFVREGVEFTGGLRPYGDVVRYDAVGETFVAVFDPELVETVLVERSEEFPKAELELALREVLGENGLVLTTGEQWRRQRRALQSVFTPRRVQSFGDVVVAQIAETTREWDDGAVVAMRPTASSLTLDVLARTLLDVDLDGSRGDVVSEAVDALDALVDPASLTSLLPAWVPTPAERRFDRAMAEFDALVRTLVAERRSKPAVHDDLLASVLEATSPDGSTMDEETVRDQVLTFLFAGHETTALSLTYALWSLAGEPTVRERLDEELADVLGERDPTVADLPNLDYTERVVRESLRLYPPVSFLLRQPRAETTLGGYRLGPDQTIQLSTYDVHRDERWYDDPETFRPDRWGEETDANPAYAYFPFGGGPRHCIGMRFATMELTLALATLARRFEFERVGDEFGLELGLLLEPTTDVQLRVRRRN